MCVCHKLIQVQSWLSDVLQQQLTLPDVNKFGGSLSRCHLCIGNNDMESMIQIKLEKEDLVFLLQKL